MVLRHFIFILPFVKGVASRPRDLDSKILRLDYEPPPLVKEEWIRITKGGMGSELFLLY